MPTKFPSCGYGSNNGDKNLNSEYVVLVPLSVYSVFGLLDIIVEPTPRLAGCGGCWDCGRDRFDVDTEAEDIIRRCKVKERERYRRKLEFI